MALPYELPARTGSARAPRLTSPNAHDPVLFIGCGHVLLVDGTSYIGSHKLNISMAPSGALELDWDNGKQVGVGQVIGDVLAVACLSKGRTVILTMNINPDGSLSGKWSRRTDRGTHGTETWTKS